MLVPAVNAVAMVMDYIVSKRVSLAKPSRRVVLSRLSSLEDTRGLVMRITTYGTAPRSLLCSTCSACMTCRLYGSFGGYTDVILVPAVRSGATDLDAVQRI